MKPLSKNREVLLALFFTNPDKSYYLQEIGRIVGKKPGVFQRTINNLAEETILLSEYKGNLRLFKANKGYPFYKELRKIVLLAAGLEAELRIIVNNIRGIDTAFVYGSFAEGTARPDSDLDLMILGNPDEDTLMRDLDKLEKKYGREINYVIYSRREFKEKINNDNSFAANVVDRPKSILKGDINDFR